MARYWYFGITHSELKERIKTGKGASFVFYGEEELLKKFYLDKLVDMVEKEGMAEFNYSVLDFAGKNTLGDLEDEVGIFPVMGEHRLVVVRGLDLPKLSNSDLERLKKILTDTPEYLFVVIYISENEFLPDKDAQKKPFVKALSEKAVFVQFPLQTERTLVSWLQKIAVSENVSVSPEAVKLIISLCDGRMMNMKKELDKLIMYALSQNKSEISKSDVEMFVEADPDYAVYQLSDAVLIGDIYACENMLSALKKHKAEPVMITAAVSRTIVGALAVLSGATYEDAGTGLGLRDWQFNSIRQKTFGKKRENFEKALLLCVEYDNKLKNQNSDSFLVCEELIFKLTRLTK